MKTNLPPIRSSHIRRFTLLVGIVASSLALHGQTLLDNFSDGDLTASPAWSGDTTSWAIVANSDAAAGTTASQTLRFAGPATSTTEYLSTQIASWADSQEWGVWVGRRAQAFTAANQQFIWLYANESTLTSTTVDGYRLAIGDNNGGDEIRLDRIVNGAVASTVITSSGALANDLTDIGFLVRVTRSSSGEWTLYTSTLPTVVATGAIASDIPSSANASVNQGSGTDNNIVPSADGYFGFAVLHSAGNNARATAELDQIYFTPTTACTPPTATVSGSATICTGSSTTIEAALTGTGPWDVTWSDSVTQTGIASSPATRDVSPTTTTTYTVTAVSDANGCTPGTFSSDAVVTVNQPVTPSVSISANPGTTTCVGNQVIFTATPVNGGGSPTYVWKTNSVQDTSVPAGSVTYTNSSLANGETIDCQMTSSLTCVTTSTADAPQLTMTITASVVPSVSVASDHGTTICAGTTVIFTATPINGGSSPSYVWKTNSVQDTSVSAGSATYTNSTLADNDKIDCELISNDPCASPTIADATQISMTVNVSVTPSVSITADPGSTICSNSSVTFTATPVSGGASPTYQWKTNGVDVAGQTATTFATSLLKNDDVVTVVMTPSADICVSPANATSSGIAMVVNALPTIALGANPAVCVGATSTSLPYNATVGSPDQYSIVFDSAAHTAGFVDVALTALPVSPIIIAVPVTAAPAVYQGTVLANNSSTGCSGSGSTFAVTVSGAPSSTITAPGGVCADSSGNLASVPNAGGIASGASYAWTISGGTITSAEPQTNRVTFTAGSSGTVVLGCSVVSSNGCASVDPDSATVAINSSALTPWVMSSGSYFENFTDIANWKDGFTCGQAANYWSAVAVNATGTIPDGARITVATATFASGFSQGVQRGSGTIVLLAVNATDNTTSSAIDLNLDFTGRSAGTLAFDWAEVNNSTGDRRASLRVYTSTDGTTWTELAGAAVLNFQNNVASSGSLSGVALPTSFDNNANARIRFYIYNGTGGTTGSRPKIALDNVAVTSTCNAPITATPTTPSATVCAGTAVTLTETASGGLPPFTYQWKKGGEIIPDATSATYTISSSATTDSGIYTCDVTSSCGASATSPGLELTVNPLPTVTVVPATTNAECGSTIILTANPVGDGPLTYQWYDTQTNAIAGETNVTLTLTNVHGAHAGNYTIAVTGPFCTESAVASVTVADIVAPVITLLGANPATNECHLPYVDAGAIADDACAGSVVLSTNGTVDANVPGVYVVTYTADDGNGNTNSATRTVYVVDTLPPMIVCTPDKTVECGSLWTFDEPAVLDGCSGPNVILIVLDTATNGLVFTRTWAASDPAGHTNTCSQSVTVADSLGPVITLLGANPATNECHAAYTDAGATASDACAGEVTVATNSTVDANLPGVYLVTYTADDGVGHTNTATRTVYVVDTTAPLITYYFTNLTLSADSSCLALMPDVTGTNYILAEDVCGTITITQTPTNNALLNLGTNEVVLAVADSAGNTVYSTNTIVVGDTTPPAITLNGANPLTVECHGEFADPGASANDNCSGIVAMTTNGVVNGDVPGSYTIEYSATDAAGNSTTNARIVNVVDTLPPVIVCMPSKNVECGSAWTFDEPTALDSCSGTNVILVVLDTTTNGLIFTRTWAASDPADHTNTCSQVVTLVDTTPPVITFCPTNRSLTVDNTCVVVLPDFTGEFEANDACSGVSLSQSPLPGIEIGVGQLIVTFTASDAASNSSICTLLLNVTAPAGANTNISISEFLAKNTVGITDDFGAFSDWIEIHNAGTCAVNLDGWSLTDAATSLAKWQFPSTNIGPGQFLVVWASDQNRRIPGAPLHTNFKLSDEGEYLGLVQPDGVTVATQFAPAFPPQLTDVAYGLPADGPTNTFLAWPTPGLANSPATNFIVGGTNVIISEFMAKNTFTLADEDGEYSDWIEVYNAGNSTVNLNNWSLTDNPAQLTKWRFPATNIAAGQFLLVWASDKNRRTPGAPLHTNFKMSDEGEYLALVQPDGVTIATQFAPTFLPQFPDVSFGLPSDGMTNNYLTLPTPGLSNSPETNFTVANLEFSPGRGWFKNGVSVSIASPTPGVTIYWTTDGTVPGPTNGSVYSGPLAFSDTTILRAAAYRPAYLPTVATHTYVFPRQVANQTGAGFPPNWGLSYAGLVPPYYAFNSNLVNDPQWRSQMPAALRSLPTLSVVMNPDDMFGTNGIYSNPFGDGDEWERPCSVEYFRPDGEAYFGPDEGTGFQINCGIRIQGSSSRDPTYTPKHNLRLLFKQEYGAAPLDFDLYPGSPVQQFHTLVLHASSGDHWFGVGATAQLHRDQWVADTQQETGGFGTHGVYVQLYINGLYWGVFNVGERPDVDYAVSYLGGNKANYDIFNGEELKDGTTNALVELLAIAQAGITNDIAWSNVNHYLDIPTFIDFLMINWYTINHDFTGHNYWLNGSVNHGVPFHFLTWDAESTFDVFRTVPLDYPIIDLTETGSGPVCLLYASLRQYPEFRRLFGDHAHRLLFNHGALTSERSADRWMKRALEIDTAIVAESLRWGITNWWASNYWGWDWKLNTRDDWITEQTYLMTNWFPQRTDILIGQLRDAGLYPTLDAPVFSPYGGIIVESLPVTISPPADATLYYTTNGADPRLPDGNVSPDAFVSAQELTVTLTGDTLLRARAFATNSWSALVEASYIRSSEVELRLDGITGRSDRTVELDIAAWPGAAYSLRASTNLNAVLTNWETIATIVPFPDGTFTYVDTNATNYPARFYRLIWP